ncbi:hypothetical protein [Hyalangium minutum]|nr:hypothetical protein [Hyalangium minutum]
MAASIQLAMDEFLPWDAPPSSSPIAEEQCLHRRESYNVTAAPTTEGIMLVRFDLNTEACQSSDQLVNVTTYAIDIRTMRILSRAMRTRPNPARLQPLQPLPDVASPPEQALPPTSGAEGTPRPAP